MAAWARHRPNLHRSKRGQLSGVLKDHSTKHKLESLSWPCSSIDVGYLIGLYPIGTRSVSLRKPRTLFFSLYHTHNRPGLKVAPFRLPPPTNSQFISLLNVSFYDSQLLNRRLCFLSFLFFLDGANFCFVIWSRVAIVSLVWSPRFIEPKGEANYPGASPVLPSSLWHWTCTSTSTTNTPCFVRLGRITRSTYLSFKSSLLSRLLPPISFPII